jgi:lipid-A-disaccharide synthase
MKVALIAGETSGDQLGGWLMEALKRRRSDLQFIGIGGLRMHAQGLESVFPMQELSLFGFFEVLPHVRNIQRRLQQTVEFIERERPEILVTIDVPGFTLRVVKALRERQIYVPRCVHYVAPSVWAYKPNRAKLIAERVDALLTLLPFEPPYFTREGLETHFVGHEIAWYWREKGDGAAFRARHGIAADAPLLAVFPGSRRGELNRLLPIFEVALTRMAQTVPGLVVVMQVPQAQLPLVREMTNHWAVRPVLISNAEEKKDFFAAATAALVKSGTIALECALAGLPAIVTYRTHPLTALLLKHTLKIPYVSLANILLKKEVVPELLQGECNPGNIASTLGPLLEHTAAREAQRSQLAALPGLLGATDSESPSDKAATVILNGF